MPKKKKHPQPYLSCRRLAPAALILQAGIGAYSLYTWPAQAQSGPLAYNYRGADGGCCSGGIHPDNGHDGQWGQIDFGRTDSNLNISAPAPGQTGIFVDVSGGHGGNGKDASDSHWGGNGGGGRIINYGVAHSTITSGGRGIDLHSNGGNGGLYADAHGPYGGYGIGGDGHQARVTLTDTQVTAVGLGVSVQSQGGAGSDSAMVNGFGGERDSGSGGNAGPAMASLQGSSTVTVTGSGQSGAGVAVLSQGGTGGTASHTGDFGGHSNAGKGGDAAEATYTSSGASVVTSSGDAVYGVMVRSIGGDASADNETDTRAADGGNSGSVVVYNAGSITTQGKQGIGIFALSQGGHGGNGGAGSWSSGHPGGAGGTPGAVTITNTGSIKTGTSGTVGAKGIVANVVGGEGGAGGDNGTFFGHGGNGGPGAAAGQAIVITNGGSISTEGNDAAAVVANSAGGGGGLAEPSSGLISVGGGHGGAGGSGGGINMTNTGNIDTAGDNSAGVVLQSIGGGGGMGGDANATGVIASIAVGGGGGAAGNGGQVSFSTRGRIATQAGHATAVVLQSIGGGGGSAGSANAVGVGVGLNVTLANGGRAGSAGSGGTVTFAQDSLGEIFTLGPHSHGVLGQSLGGGGGEGGMANTHAITIAPVVGDDPSGAVTLSISNGGTGGAGGNGGAVMLANNGRISTQEGQSVGMVAQSIGGGGGSGGGVLAPVQAPVIGDALVNLQLSVRHGGQGGSGGSGGEVTVSNSGTGSISTAGMGSAGLVAQSIGGGGGSGGIVQEHDAASFNAILGSPGELSGLLDTAVQWLEKGPEFKFNKAVELSAQVTTGGSGGSGGSASAFNVRNDGHITTAGDNAPGIVAQSVGGGGGNAGLIDSSGASSLLASIDSLIEAAGSAGQHVFTVALPQTHIVHQTGGSGGAAGNGGGTASAASLVRNTGTIRTQGDGSAGIVAQSVGGGGGLSTSSGQDLQHIVQEAAGNKSAEILEKITHVIEVLGSKGGSALGSIINVRNGGTDGASGAGGVTHVDAGASTSLIETAGRQAPGILAQSVGGGGGMVSASQPMFFWSNTTAGIALGAGNGPAQIGMSSQGDEVDVSHGGAITTQGSNSAGIWAQSIGGGGGLTTLHLQNASLAAISQSATPSIALGGEFQPVQPGFGNPAQVPAGAVSVSNTGGHIATQGLLAPGIVAQSVGGGGGAAIVSSSAALSGVNIRLGAVSSDYGFGASPTGNGGSVSVTNAGGSITTRGALSFGILAQSIGGGGGYVALDDTVKAAAVPMDIVFGAGAYMTADAGAVSVTQDASASIQTAGVNAHGIVAQSVGGGGGIAGLTTQPGLITLKPAGAAQMSGAGGAVTLAVAGSVTTAGAGAAGILAQSIGGGGGLGGDMSSALYPAGIIQSAGLTAGDGNGGNVNVNVGSAASIRTSGASAPAILAMSVGGGGVFKDGVLYQYNAPGGHQMYGGPIHIGIGQAAQVVAEGAGAPALVAVSNGANGGGKPITIDVGAQALLGASQATGTGVLAVTPLGAVTINNAGTIQAGTAINVPGLATVNNGGTVAGDVLMGNGSTFNNNAGANLYSGTDFQGRLNNAGVLNPGGPGAYRQTRVAGVWNNTGTYRPDLDFAGHNSDFVSVSDASTFTGTIKPVLHNPVKDVWLGIAHFDAAQTSVPLLDSDTPLFQYALKNNGGPGLGDPLISVQANFTPAAFTLSDDRGNVARSLQELWDRGDPGSARLFDKFTGIQSADQYRNTLNGVVHDGQFARATNQAQASYASMNRMMSCPGFVGDSTLLREGDCTWARLEANWVRRDTTSDDEGYGIRQNTLTVGVQRELAHNWFLGGTLSYTDGRTTSSSDLSGDSETYAGGLVLKYNPAPWQMAVAIHGGVEKSRMSRSTLDGVAKSRPESSFLAGRLRIAYEFSQPSWYLRPYADLDVFHIRQHGYEEYGPSLLNLKVHANSTTSVMLTPMLEVGGRRNLANGAILRGYAAAGVSLLNGADVVTTVQFSGLNTAPFSLRSGMPGTYANLTAGLEYVSAKGLEVKTEYALRANGQYRDQSVTLRAAYRF